MKEITLPATLENLASVQAFIEGELEAADCPVKAMMQISIAVEEIYVNIAHYAYNPEVGEATVRCAVGGDPLQVTVQFLDRRRHLPLRRGAGHWGPGHSDGEKEHGRRAVPV